MIPKAPLLVGDPATFTTVSGGGTLGAVKTFDADAPAQYFVRAENGNSGVLRLEAIVDSPGVQDYHVYQLSVPPFSHPPGAAQQGTSNLASTVDFRIKHGVYRNGFLWTSHTVAEDGVARVRWYQVAMNGWPTSGSPPDLVQTGSLDLGPGVYTWFSDVSVDEYDNMAMVFNRSSTSEFISVNRTFRRPLDPPGTLRQPTVMQLSTSPELGPRWGDYAGIDEDPGQSGTFWVHSEYRTSDWRTWAGRFAIPQGTGDFDGDGDIDLEDVSRFLNCFTGAAGTLAPGCEAGDLDGGDAIDLRDLNQFHDALTGPS